RSTTSQALFTSVQRSAVGVDAIDGQLEFWAGDRPRKVPLTTTRVVEVLQRALALGLPPNVRQDGLRAVLDHLPLAQLLIQANTFTLTNPILAELLLSAAETRQHDESERDSAHEALESAEYLMHCIPVLVPDAQAAANRWHQVLLAAYGREL